MTSAELHAHFTHLLGEHAHGVDARLGDVDSKLTNALEKIDCLEEAFNSKLDTKFQEILTRLPQPRNNVRHTRRIPREDLPAGTAAAAPSTPETTTDKGYDDYGGDDELVDENVLDGEEVGIKTLAGTESANVDPDKMTNAEMHAHFLHLLSGHATDVDGRLGDVDAKLTDALDKIDGLEAAFNTKLDAKFQELLTRLPPPRQRATPRTPRSSCGRSGGHRSC
ncbi:hypothetical protein QYE76_034749 [Lolium multiflorum]|uniref:Uncharacterized protein n=1 Tax=Lolium multiflorum TaxID=4521 RepID=A0AAD8VMU0_LOLMU|nr:hypothetical protein QYE76_034749 [Lolium multiflorum]